MNDMIKRLFPEGQRKLIVSLIGLVIAIGFEKFTKQGLTEDMKTSIIALVAIFTGGNVMEHFASAVKVLKGTKVGAIIEAALPGDQGLTDEEPQKEEADYEDRFAAIEKAQHMQAQNINQIVQILNQMRGNGPQQPPKA